MAALQLSPALFATTLARPRFFWIPRPSSVSACLDSGCVSQSRFFSRSTEARTAWTRDSDGLSYSSCIVRSKLGITSIHDGIVRVLTESVQLHLAVFIQSEIHHEIVTAIMRVS